MKRKVIFSFLISIISLTAICQKPSCESLRIGLFEVVAKDIGTTLIKRTENEQLEKNESMGYEIVFSITWLDDCTYELRPKKLIKGDPIIMGDGTSFVRTRIKEITSRSYIAETTSSFSEQTIEFLVDIVH